MRIYFKITFLSFILILMIGCATAPQPDKSERPFPTQTLSPTATVIHTQTPLPPTQQPPTGTAVANTAVPATTTPLPYPGHLLFSSRRIDTNGDGAIQVPDGIHIYKMTLSTGKISRLTNGNAYDTDPAWSPDGGQITFVSTRSGDVALYVMNADGSDVQQLMETDGRIRHPNWSPDGNQIVYSGGDFITPSLFVYTLADGSIQQLTDGDLGDSEPDWSRNGRAILFTRTDPSNNTPSTIHLLDLETNAVHSLPSPPTGTQFSHPRWIPGDDTIISLLQTETDANAKTTLLIFDIAWENGTLHFTQRPLRITNATDIAWTIDGQWLLGSILRADGADLAIMPVDINAGGLLQFELEGETAVSLTHDDFFESNLDWRE
ncbi:MAG: hypothetical protein GY943_32295 [Chloroflexi bacterium]|nr:hypothetical protein [Chloroflexota bacterium]